MTKTKTKTKKTTMAAILKAMPHEDADRLSVTYGDGENAVEIHIKKNLSLIERMNMVSDIADMVFITDGEGNTEYVPAFEKFAIEYEIVNYFTDIVLPVGDSNKTWLFLTKTGIAAHIANAVPNGHVFDIIAEAKELIEYRKQLFLKRSRLDVILDNIVSITKGVGDKIDGMDSPELKDIMERFIEKDGNESEASVE